MTALANAIKRKTHKERAQPASRRKYGLLEKHKDYVQRAKDFHKKEKTIKALQRKAEERNPDEFYFGMEKAKTKDGVHDGRLTKANKYSQEELALMKTQDVKYLSLKARTEEQKAKRLKESLHFIGVTAPTVPAAGTSGQKQKQQQQQQQQQQGEAEGLERHRHVVFVDSEREAKAFDPAAYFNTPAELLDRAFNRPRHEQLATAGAVVGRESRKIERRKNDAYKELSQRLMRQQKLAASASHLEYANMVAAASGRKRKLQAHELLEGTDAHAKVFKWKRERKK